MNERLISVALPVSVLRVRPDSNLSSGDFEDLSQLHVALSGYAREEVLGRPGGGVRGCNLGGTHHHPFGSAHDVAVRQAHIERQREGHRYE